MSFRFQFRRGTTAERNASNPILAAGEPAVVLDSGQPAELVLGDGVTAMADLRAAVWDDDTRLAAASTAVQPAALADKAARINPTFTSTAPTETATLGPERITDTGWTLGAGWSGTFATGYTHAAGGGTAALTWAPGFSTASRLYYVAFTVTSASNSSAFTVTLGGSFGMIMYEGAVGGVWTYARGITALADGSLVFTPETGFDGTITAVSVKELTAPGTAAVTVLDSTGSAAVEIRGGLSTFGNTLIGDKVGRYLIGGPGNSGRGNAVVGSGAFAVSSSGFWNSGLGYKVLEACTNGTRNVGIGVFALQSVTAGHRNIAIGPYAGCSITTGHSNIAIGVDVAGIVTGRYNIVLGEAAMASGASGDCNIAVGRATLTAGNGLSDHVAIGDYALCYLTDQSSGVSVAVGHDALRNSIKGGNTAIGDQAAAAITTATDNVAVGRWALKAATTSGLSTAVGAFAAQNTTGQRNVAVGAYALSGAAGSTAERNTVVGYSAGLNLATGGSYNTILGASAGQSLTTGNQCILIGYNVQAYEAISTYYLNIGDTIYGRLSKTNKQIGISVLVPSARMHLPASDAAAGHAPLKIDAGTILTTPEAGAIEFDGTNLYFTTAAGVRKTLAVV